MEGSIFGIFLTTSFYFTIICACWLGNPDSTTGRENCWPSEVERGAGPAGHCRGDADEGAALQQQAQGRGNPATEKGCNREHGAGQCTDSFCTSLLR